MITAVATPSISLQRRQEQVHTSITGRLRSSQGSPYTGLPECQTAVCLSVWPHAPLQSAGPGSKVWGSLVEASRSFCCSQEWFQGFHSHVSGTRRLLLLTCHFHLINMCVCAEKETLDLHMEQKLLSWAQQKEWKLETAESGANVKKWAKTEAHTNVQVWKSWSQRT